MTDPKLINAAIYTTLSIIGLLFTLVLMRDAVLAYLAARKDSHDPNSDTDPRDAEAQMVLARQNVRRHLERAGVYILIIVVGGLVFSGEAHRWAQLAVSALFYGYIVYTVFNTILSVRDKIRLDRLNKEIQKESLEVQANSLHVHTIVAEKIEVVNDGRKDAQDREGS